MGKLTAALVSIAAVASFSLNIALVQRLQSVALNDPSYVLDPKNGLVWRIDTHAEFVHDFASGSLLPYWAQAPKRVETISSLVLLGQLTAITDKCDWRRLEQYRKLQRACFRHLEINNTEPTYMLLETAAEISPEFVDHPIVALMATRLAEMGRGNDSPALVMPVVIADPRMLLQRKESQSQPKAAILFRGWAARNFEIATAMVPPTLDDYSER